MKLSMYDLARSRGISGVSRGSLVSATSAVRRTMKGAMGSIRFSRHRHESMKLSTFSTPSRSMWRRTRVA